MLLSRALKDPLWIRRGVCYLALVCALVEKEQGQDW